VKGSRFWLRPKWVFGHVLCLTLVVTFVNLGFWQLRRLDERRDRGAVVEARAALPPTTLDRALADGAAPAVYRRVRVTGTWLPDETFLVRSRSLDQQAGYHVLTTVRIGRGRGVVVNRGFVPVGGGGEPAILRTVRPEASRVTVTGLLRASEERGRFGPKDPATGRLQVVNRVEIDRLQQQSAVELAPVFLQRSSSTPAELPVVRTLPPPATDDGPHLSYAVQWFIFATVGAVGWPVLLWRTAREHDDQEPPRSDGQGRS
jgi:surfeit locus 1 family protein